MRLRLALCGVLVLLAACATTPRAPVAPPAEAGSWPARRAALQSLPGFELHGRVAVSTGSDGFSAKLRWTQAGAQSDLALDGPLGVGGVRVSSDGKDLQLTTPKGERLDRQAAQTELQTRLGFEPPIGELRYWVLGVPAPAGEAQETLDADSRLVALEQDGWHIDYADYRAAAAASDARPSRVTLTRGTLRVRLLIDNWG